MDLPKEVTIKRLDKGFLVTVGCKTLAAATWSEVRDGLSQYWKDPEKAYKKFFPNDNDVTW